jgi:hypothetical protein
MTPEGDILKACLQYLHYRGIFCWRNNQGVIPTGRGTYRRFAGLRGVSDILGVLDKGRFLAVEVKSLKGKTSPEQTAFLARVTSLGGVACVVRSVEELEKDLQEAGVL